MNLAQAIDPARVYERFEEQRRQRPAPLPAMGAVVRSDASPAPRRGNHSSELSALIRRACGSEKREFSVDEIHAAIGAEDYDRKQVSDRLNQLHEWGDLARSGTYGKRRYTLTAKGREKLQAQGEEASASSPG